MVIFLTIFLVGQVLLVGWLFRAFAAVQVNDCRRCSYKEHWEFPLCGEDMDR